MNQLVISVRNQGWAAMIREQKQSGLTIKEWCSRNHISEHCFYYRQQKLREAAMTDPETRFAELLPPHRTASRFDGQNSTACIEYGDLRVVLSNDISEELLLRILRGIRHA